MKTNWWSLLVAVSVYGTSKPRLQRRRSSRIPGVDEPLEIRLLLSSQSASPEVTGLPGTNDDEDFDENTPADMPVEVIGAFLTSQSRADSKPMFFNDVRQGQLDTCVFVSTLAAVALTDFNLADAISLHSQTSAGNTYMVRLWAKNAQNQFVPHNQTVYFDFHLTPQDPQPGDNQEYWTAIFQRAYLDLASSLGRNYKVGEFALESLIGNAASRHVMQNSLSFANQIQTDLLAGRATVTATIDSPSRYIGGSYGLVHNHAYTVMGIEIPTSNSLNDVYITVRNPWGTDTGLGFFDADQNGTLSATEYRNYQYGIDGTNDGLIRLPWSVFAANFQETYVSSRTGANINTPLPVYSFTKPSPPEVTIYEGQRLRVDVATTHSSGWEVYYLMNSAQGNVHMQEGIFEWEPRAATAGRHAVSIRAFINPFVTTDIAFIVTVLPSGPTIGSVTASPTTIKNDGSDLLILTANNIQAPYAQAEALEFWLDQDQNNEFDANVDRWLGVAGDWQGHIGGLNIGSQTFFVRAYWNSFGDRHYGAASAVSVNVVAAPFVETVAIPRGGQTTLTSSEENNYAIRTLQDASGQYRVLSRWEYSIPVPGTSRGNYYSEYRVRLLDENGALMQTTAVAEKSAGAPDLFVRDDGTFAVVWPAYIQNQVSIKSQWYNADGSPQSGTTVIDTNAQDVSNVKIAGDRDGNLLVVYNVGSYFDEDIWSLSVGRDGTVTRAPWRVNTNTESMQKNATVAINDDGVGVIAWSDFGDGRTVARQVWNYGLQDGDEITVSPYARADRFLGSAVNLAGEFFIAFYNDETLIFVQKFSAAGVAMGEAFQANSFLGSYCEDPLISLNDAGWMVVAWNNRRQDGTANNEMGVYAQLFDPSGNRYGGEFAVPVERDYEQVLRSAVLDGVGRLHFTWSDGGYYNPGPKTVATRLFDVKLPPVIAANQSFDIAENLPAGTVVGTVAAADPNPDSVVSFWMVGFSEFSIDPVTGIIKTTAPLDFETRNTFSLDIRVTSNDGFAVGVVTVNVTNVDEPPQLTSLNTISSFLENGTPAQFGDDLQFSDIDSTVFQGLTVKAAIIANVHSGDRLSFATLRGIALVGNQVLLHDTLIGTLLSSGIGSESLQVHLNENATLIAVRTLLSSLHFWTSGNVASGTRTVEISVLDEGNLPIAVQAMTINVTAVNDRPVAITSSVRPLPATVGASFEVAWSSLNNGAGTSVDFYDIYVAVNDEDYRLWLERTNFTSAVFEGQPGNTYAFYSIATDNHGQRELKDAVAEATTAVEFIDDLRGITVSAISGSTTEYGGMATFTVVLNSQPTGNVTIPISSSDSTEGTVAPASLTFTAVNWNVAQTVTVSGVSDNEVDGDVAYTVFTGPATGGDYDGLNAGDILIFNIDSGVANVAAPVMDLNGTAAGADSSSLYDTATGGMQQIASGDLMITDEDHGDSILSGTVTIESGFQSEDVIDVTTVQGITVNLQGNVLTLEGEATADVYAQVLRTLTFSTTSTDATARTLVMRVTDSAGNASEPRNLTVNLSTGPVFASIDIDQSGGAAAAQSDGLLVFAVLAGVTSTTQLTGLVSSGGTSSVPEIVSNVQALGDQLLLDVDGNGSVSAQSDGLLIFAILAGVTSPSQLANLLGSGATRSVPEIIEYVQTLGAPPPTSASAAPDSVTVLPATELPVMAATLSPSIPGIRDVVLRPFVETLRISQPEVGLPQSHADEQMPMDALVASPVTDLRDTTFRRGNSGSPRFSSLPLSSTSPSQIADLDLLDNFFDAMDEDHRLLSF